jgi:hypothetical protein
MAQHDPIPDHTTITIPPPALPHSVTASHMIIPSPFSDSSQVRFWVVRSPPSISLTTRSIILLHDPHSDIAYHGPLLHHHLFTNGWSTFKLDSPHQDELQILCIPTRYIPLSPLDQWRCRLRLEPSSHRPWYLTWYWMQEQASDDLYGWAQVTITQAEVNRHISQAPEEHIVDVREGIDLCLYDIEEEEETVPI